MKQYSFLYISWVIIVIVNLMLIIDNYYKYANQDISFFIQIGIICSAIFWVIFSLYLCSPNFYKNMVRRLKEKW